MDYVTLKVRDESRRMLRLIAAATGEQMVDAIDRVLREECERRGLPTELPTKAGVGKRKESGDSAL